MMYRRSGRALRVAVLMTAGMVLGTTVDVRPVQAETTVSSKSRARLFSTQTRLLDSRASSQYAASVRLQPPTIRTPSKTSGPAYVGKYNGPYLSMAKAAARRHGIPEDLFARLVQQESGWNSGARSHKGAMGLAQLMPATARYVARIAGQPRPTNSALHDPHLPAKFPGVQPAVPCPEWLSPVQCGWIAKVL